MPSASRRKKRTKYDSTWSGLGTQTSWWNELSSSARHSSLGLTSFGAASSSLVPALKRVHVMWHGSLWPRKVTFTSWTSPYMSPYVLRSASGSVSSVRLSARSSCAASVRFGALRPSTWIEAAGLTFLSSPPNRASAPPAATTTTTSPTIAWIDFAASPLCLRNLSQRGSSPDTSVRRLHAEWSPASPRVVPAIRENLVGSRSTVPAVAARRIVVRPQGVVAAPSGEPVPTRPARQSVVSTRSVELVASALSVQHIIPRTAVFPVPASVAGPGAGLRRGYGAEVQPRQWCGQGEYGAPRGVDVVRAPAVGQVLAVARDDLRIVLRA